MKKFYCILLMVGLLLALSHAALADVCNNAWDGVVKDIPALFNKLDGELIGIEISGRAKVNDQDMTFDQLDQLFNEVANQFGHLAGPIERVGQGLSASVRQIKGQAIRGQNLYTVALNNGYNLAEGGGYETYIVVNIASKPMPDTGVKSLRQTLFDFLASYSNDPCMGTLYKARTQKKLDKKSMINTSKQIFDALEGKIIEGIEEEYLVSKTGYSSLIENCLYVDGEKMNLNLALRYKEFEDATYIWLGTPVIFSSY